MLLSFQKYMTEVFILQCSDSYLESKARVLIQKKAIVNNRKHHHPVLLLS